MWGAIVSAVLGAIPSLIKSIAEARRAKREQEARFKAEKEERIRKEKIKIMINEAIKKGKEKKKLDPNPY